MALPGALVTWVPQPWAAVSGLQAPCSQAPQQHGSEPLPIGPLRLSALVLAVSKPPPAPASLAAWPDGPAQALGKGGLELQPHDEYGCVPLGPSRVTSLGSRVSAAVS